jgi:hypothetical protein
VLVWVKGKDVAFDKGTETTAYVSGDARLAEFRPSTDSPAAPYTSADRRISPGVVLTNADIAFCRRLAGFDQDPRGPQWRNQARDRWPQQCQPF